MNSEIKLLEGVTERKSHTIQAKVPPKVLARGRNDEVFELRHIRSKPNLYGCRRAVSESNT